MNPSAKPQGRNVLNPDDAKLYAESVGRDRAPHVKKWFDTTFRRWLLNTAPFIKPCIDAKEANSPWLYLIDKFLGSVPMFANASVKDTMLNNMHLIDMTTAEDWVVKAINNKEMLVRLTIMDDNDEANYQHYRHWGDYLETLPERDIFMSVEALQENVAAWDRQLQREKFIGTLEDGVEFVENFSANALNSNVPLVLVKLMTERAYKNEGNIMSHCVGGGAYWKKRKSSAIYSLRAVDSTQRSRPLATMEVAGIDTDTPWIQQIQDYDDERPPAWIRELLGMWAAANGISPSRYPKGNRIVDDFDGEDLDYDEDEDDEEELPVARVRPARKAKAPKDDLY